MGCFNPLFLCLGFTVMTENSNTAILPKTPSKKTFEINGESKTLMISFAAQQQIVHLYGGLENINSLFSDPNVQTQAVAIVYFGKQYKEFKNLEDIFENISDIDADSMNEILVWIQEYFMDFMLSQTQKMTGTLTSAKSLIEKIQKV